MKRLLFLIYLVTTISGASAQTNVHAYPTNWWIGMRNPQLQLLFHVPDMQAGYGVFMDPYPGVKVVKTHAFKNTNYFALDLTIAKTTKPGKLKFKFRKGNEAPKEFVYELKARHRDNGRTRIRGINSEDLIYLIMPDRFSNGDTANDRVSGMKDQSLNRNEIFHRHGGDLKGIRNHLDYLQDLGVTALWLNPVLENDMPERTEHGYAATNHYAIDPRLGGDQAYHDLIEDLHKRGMKIIQDAVYNHVGIDHFLFRDLPDSTWFHFWPTYTNTTYKDQVLMDPYAAPSDKKKMSDGWFVPSMPDLNQQNPFVANFLIQHAIWSTETFGLDGFRIDTYAYNDLAFMNRCNQALLDEFPLLHIFGETWVHGVINQSYFSENVYDIAYKSNLPGVTDFQLNLYGIVPALTQPFGWTEGLNRLYLTASNDFVYQHPMKNVIFLDNHDMSRFYSVVGEDMRKMKMGLAWLLTYRGIPQLYYGTEVLLKNFANPDGLVRQDFPGGWAGDAANKFDSAGRTSSENEVFNYVKTMANFRKRSSALKTGAMMHYVPEDGTYVYFRYDARQTVMCIMNSNDKDVELDDKKYIERTAGYFHAKDIATDSTISLVKKIKVPAKSTLVLELIK